MNVVSRRKTPEIPPIALRRQFVSDLGKLKQAPVSECGETGTGVFSNVGSKPKDLLQHHP